MVPSTTAFNETMWTAEWPRPGSLPATSLAPGRLQSVTGGTFAAWNYPFGIAAGSQINSHNAVGASFTPTYRTDSGLALFRLDAKILLAGQPSYIEVSDTVQSASQLDTGEMQVAQFTVSGSADQVPWVFVTSNGRRVAYAYSSGVFTYVGGPQESGHNFNVDCMTDHYIAANYGSYGAVYKWTGTALGKSGTWSKLMNSDHIPSGGYVAQLAYAAALPGTQIGTIGPSHLYMIDSYNNIYQWGDVTGGGGVVK